MNRIDLTGLRADVPIGAMAAFGCLRISNRITGFEGSKLSWSGAAGSFHAVLWSPEVRSRDELVTALLSDVQAASHSHLRWSEQIKTADRERFSTAAAEALEVASSADRERADWFAAFGSDLALDDDKIDSTPLDMSVARQRFLADALKLAAGLAEDRPGRGKSSRDSYHEALFGPWRYTDDQHSLGWDPSTMKLGAFTYKAPTAMANTGVRAAVWLAFESLPLFPCFWRRGLITRGFRPERRQVALCWPAWNHPISLAALGTLLGWEELTSRRPNQAELVARGISAVYCSPVFKPNKYLASFRTPELISGGAAMAAGRAG